MILNDLYDVKNENLLRKLETVSKEAVKELISKTKGDTQVFLEDCLSKLEDIDWSESALSGLRKVDQIFYEISISFHTRGFALPTGMPLNPRNTMKFKEFILTRFRLVD